MHKKKLSSLFFLFCFFVAFVSCTAKSLIIASDVESAYYITEAYNTQYPNPLLQLFQYESVYESIVQSRANILISKTMPPKHIEKNLLNANVKNNTQNIVNIESGKTALLAFSLPLIVTLKSSQMPMPSNGMLSFSELQAQIYKVSTNISKNIWAFPLKPHEDFKQVFPNDKAYEQWMQSITKNPANSAEIFVRRYNAIPFLAVLRDESIAYKFVPSHLFFSQPFVFRDLFSIALLSDDKNTIPIVAPIFISAVKHKSYKQTHSTKKLLKQLLKTSNHSQIVSFSEELFNDIPFKTQFLDRSYSNNAHFTSATLLRKNSWLATHAPPHSSLYFARNK